MSSVRVRSERVLCQGDWLHGWGVLLACCFALSSTGCWSTTQPLTPGEASEGEMGFGVSDHRHTAYMVFATIVTTITGTANVALVDEAPLDGAQPQWPTDSVWQAYAGGRKVRHCFVTPKGVHVCADAPVEGLGWGKSLVFVDPVNRGGYLAEVQATGADGSYYYAGAGAVYDHDERMRVGPGHGVWATVAGEGTLMHCQLEGQTPRCRALPADAETIFGKVVFPGTVLGVFNNEQENILWLTKFFQVLRCTTTASRPEPTCIAAKMQ